MGKIIIYRYHDIYYKGKIPIYVNGEKACQISDDQIKVLEVPNEMTKVNYKIPLMGSSNIVDVDLTDNSIARLTIKIKFNGFDFILEYGEDLLPEEEKTIRKELGIKEEDEIKRDEFNITKNVYDCLWIDETRRQWVVPKGILKKSLKNQPIYNFSDIISFELIENDAVSYTSGGAGIINSGIIENLKTTTSCNNMMIRVTINSLDKSCVFIKIVSGESKKSGFFYKMYTQIAQELIATLENMMKISNESKETKKEIGVSAADEIKKYKELLDCGAITQEEYDEKKKTLLNL